MNRTIIHGRCARIEHPCIECGRVTKRERRSMFCSVKCRGLARRKTAMTPYERVLSRIETRDGCWTVKPWARNTQGYAYIKQPWSKTMIASRVVWKHHHGPIANGLHVLHRCDNPACVNPDHLFLGTQRDNIHDMIAKGRAAWARPNWYGSKKHDRAEP